jgi:cell division GTPase FtsZ
MNGRNTNPGKIKEAETTLEIQQAEEHPSCFEKPDGQFSQTDCFNKTPGEPGINAWQLPALDLEQYEPRIEQSTSVDDQIKGSTCYGWVGVGRCGGRLVKSFYDLGYRKVLAVDTAQDDLDSLNIPKNQKFLMNVSKEYADKDMKTGQRAIQQHQQEILHLARQIFGLRVDHIMVVFGAGGGAGGGSVIGLIEIAKRYVRYVGSKNPNKNVGVVMTLPAVSKIVSPVVAKNAYKIAVKLSRVAKAGKISPLIIVDNDKINKIYPEMAIKPLWSGINNSFARLFDTFNMLSNLSSRYSSFAPADYRDIMEASGCTIMGLTKVHKFNDPFAISKAMKDNLEKTLLADGFDLSTAKAAGCIVVGGKKLISSVKGLQNNIDYAFDVLSEITGEATIHRGIYEDDGDCLRVYTIIGGLDSPTAKLRELNTNLYNRLNIANFEGPPLYQRKEDVLPLAEYFLAKQAALYKEPPKILSASSKKLLLNYVWPGNVSELASAIERAYVLTTGKEIQPAVLPFKIIFADYGESKYEMPSLDQVKRKIITQTLEFTKGSKLSAAKILGIGSDNLNRLIEKLNISATKKNTGKRK